MSVQTLDISLQVSGRVLCLNGGEDAPVKEGKSLFLIDSSKNQILLKLNNFLYRASEAVAANMFKDKTAIYRKDCYRYIQR